MADLKAHPHEVAIVVDPLYGAKLTALSQRMHVWVCDSAENRAVATQVQTLAPATSLDRGITTFQTRPDATPEQNCRDILDAVELHHGTFSHNPRWSVLNVIGARLTQELEAGLRGLGVVSFQNTAHGFAAVRPEHDAG